MKLYSFKVNYKLILFRLFKHNEEHVSRNIYTHESWKFPMERRLKSWHFPLKAFLSFILDNERSVDLWTTVSALHIIHTHTAHASFRPRLKSLKVHCAFGLVIWISCLSLAKNFLCFLEEKCLIDMSLFFLKIRLNYCQWCDANIKHIPKCNQWSWFKLVINANDLNSMIPKIP